MLKVTSGLIILLKVKEFAHKLRKFILFAFNGQKL